jgi:hypothetical protein
VDWTNTDRTGAARTTDWTSNGRMRA